MPMPKLEKINIIKKNVVVVALDDYSWKILLKDKFYIFPKSSRRVEEYFAFYKGKPLSAITHYAKVAFYKEIEVKDIPSRYWLRNLANYSSPYILVSFSKINKLRRYIKKEDGRGKGIQGRIYTSLEKLKNSKFISNLI